MAYSIWMQVKLKVVKGDFKAFQALTLALKDLILSIPIIVKNTNRLTSSEYNAFRKLEDVKVYWRPEK